MKFIGNIMCFFKFFDNIYCCQLLKKSRNEFSELDIFKMSKSEILEIVFLEENQFFSYAVRCFKLYFSERSVAA